jgi:hypothetical protein
MDFWYAAGFDGHPCPLPSLPDPSPTIALAARLAGDASRVMTLEERHEDREGHDEGNRIVDVAFSFADGASPGQLGG